VRNTAGGRFLASSAIWRANEKEKESIPRANLPREDRGASAPDANPAQAERPVNENQ